LLLKACWQARPDADAARCNSFTLARALVAALDAHAQIVNMSLSGPSDPLLGDLIREGVRRGVLFVGAAAADAPDGKAGLLHQAGVIEVASIGRPAAPGPAAPKQAAPMQAAPDSVLFAPGQEILTLLPGGHYDFASGDSIATAQVSGVVALLLARNPGLTATDAYGLMRNTSTRSLAGGGEGALVDACAALVSLIGKGSCSPSADTRHTVADQHLAPL
jgi:subtilisin family serine protease